MRPTFAPAALLALAVILSFPSCVSLADRQRAQSLADSVDPAKPFAESAFVESGGISLHYRHWMPDRPPLGRIYLLHGFGSSTFSFRFLVPELLAAGWEVAAVDIPPFGYSDKSDALARLGYDRSQLLWAVPDSLGWKDPMVILGHSMGGQYAAAMAERYPNRVRGLDFLAGLR